MSQAGTWKFFFFLNVFHCALMLVLYFSDCEIFKTVISGMSLVS